MIEEIRNMIAGLKHEPFQPMPFPELADVPSRRGEQTMREYIAIMEELMRRRWAPDSFLDIGANIGFFTLRLATAFPNSTVRAVERDVASISILTKQARWKELINIRIGSSVILGHEDFDVALMLNVHHWLAHEMHKETVWAIMDHLASHVRLLFFQTAHAESQARDPETGADLRVTGLENERGIHDYLTEVGFRNPKTILTSFASPRYLITAEGQ